MLTRASLLAVELGTVLRARLTGFTGFLRANGFGVGGADAVCVLETSVQMGILDPQVLRWSLKALLCGRGDEWRRFDGLFDAYFLPPNKSLFAQGNVDAAGALRDGAEIESAPGPGNGAVGDVDSGSARHGASREESLASTDFRELNQAENAYEIETLMRRFAKRLKPLRLRREAAHHHGHRLDLQATIRQSVSCGGTPIRLAWKEHRRVRPRLVLLVDVSRSMRLYSFFYMRLARALCAELADACAASSSIRASPTWERRSATRTRGVRNNDCTCSPSVGRGARESVNAYGTSIATTGLGWSIRAPV